MKSPHYSSTSEGDETHCNLFSLNVPLFRAPSINSRLHPDIATTSVISFRSFHKFSSAIKLAHKEKRSWFVFIWVDAREIFFRARSNVVKIYLFLDQRYWAACVCQEIKSRNPRGNIIERKLNLFSIKVYVGCCLFRACYVRGLRLMLWHALIKRRLTKPLIFFSERSSCLFVINHKSLSIEANPRHRANEGNEEEKEEESNSSVFNRASVINWNTSVDE